MRAIILAVCLVTLASCGSEAEPAARETSPAADGSATPVAVSGTCDDAVEALADDVGANPDEAGVDNPLLVGTLNECATADEWLEAVHAHPSAVPVKGDAPLDDTDFADLDLEGLCVGNDDAPVCADAASKGHIKVGE